MTAFTESEIEIFSLDELRQLGFSYVPGPSIAPDGEAPQTFVMAERTALYDELERRASYSEVVLKFALEHAIRRLNPRLPERARQEALKTALSVFSPQLIDANEAFHLDAEEMACIWLYAR